MWLLFLSLSDFKIRLLYECLRYKFHLVLNFIAVMGKAENCINIFICVICLLYVTLLINVNIVLCYISFVLTFNNFVTVILHILINLGRTA